MLIAPSLPGVNGSHTLTIIGSGLTSSSNFGNYSVQSDSSSLRAATSPSERPLPSPAAQPGARGWPLHVMTKVRDDTEFSFQDEYLDNLRQRPRTQHTSSTSIACPAVPCPCKRPCRGPRQSARQGHHPGSSTVEGPQGHII